MSFQALQARFNRQYREHSGWKLLRANNASLILAFLADLFKDGNDVSFGQARVALDTELEHCREVGIWQTDNNAMTYLREWIQAGWLRELDDQISKTDACEVALRFCQGLDQRENNATASHLRIVQEAVRDFMVAISPDADQRIELLKARQAKIQIEIDALEAGVVIQLDQAEQRERIKEIYQLASVLTGDFRRVEDDIREMDQKLRVEIIESDRSRGEILLGVLEQENLLANTDAGRAFEGFFQLLCDQNRSMEFREQLRAILNQSVAQHLSPQQSRFLSQLMRELSKESERVLQIRRRSEESLRAYIESGAHLEVKAVDKLLSKLEQQALVLRMNEVSPRTEIKLDLASGAVKISSPQSLKLRRPEEQLDTSHVQEHVNSDQPNDDMLACLDTVKIVQIADQMKTCLLAQGPLTIAAYAQHHPLKAGLEELVACLRVAKAVSAADLGEKELITVTDKQGHRFQATIPMYLLNVALFPKDMMELSL